MNTLPSPFSIDQTSPGPGAVRIHVRGDLDLSTSPRLGEALLREITNGNSVEVDLSGVTFIDSTGLNTLIGALAACESNGGALALRPNLPDQVRRVLEITGVDALLPIAPD